ncbi:MAG: hypothetical protein ACXAD7_10745 [Candidatus Kariarchaeaceae archaeon]|jgi:hypothetical protein
MANKNGSSVQESLKGFLIVGEKIDGLHSYTDYKPYNISIFLILIGVSIFTFDIAVEEGAFWYFLTFTFLLVSIYYILNFRTTVTHAITKFRIIRVIEENIISRKIFRSSRLVGFTDLHYEHVESINVGTPPLDATRLYISTLIISIGWLAFERTSTDSSSDNLIQLFAIILIIFGIFSIISSLPIGGVRLLVQSISGDSMEFPEKYTPSEFIDDLIFNCRTFLSYGAV